jgi:hypothetical protein
MGVTELKDGVVMVVTVAMGLVEMGGMEAPRFLLKRDWADGE